MDPQIVETLKAVVGPVLSGGGVLGFYLLYRKFEAEMRESLREDNKTLREERDQLRKDLKEAEAERRTRDEESAV
ncbi:hypothetical protein SAMN04489740_2675 [Arthrobacter alpinus]|uniref:Uncharacterized protein n=1 Tax=Arthrobacter alpinus TaxID=656366 RepID=A0A1H5LYY7_9MICC|nr:hypothetical protein [Arthrobacter alpinus]SEE82204.1 hypothetical protein SAMN04489740_2675 [Arthrobacter alpinus]